MEIFHEIWNLFISSPFWGELMELSKLLVHIKDQMKRIIMAKKHREKVSWIYILHLKKFQDFSLKLEFLITFSFLPLKSFLIWDNLRLLFRRNEWERNNEKLLLSEWGKNIKKYIMKNVFIKFCKKIPTRRDWASLISPFMLLSQLRIFRAGKMLS